MSHIIRWLLFIAALFFVVGAALALELPRPVLALSKYVLNEGGWIVLSCHIPNHAKNRLLRLGIEGRLPSEIQLDGYNSAPVYHRGYAVECGESVAYCIVLDSDARWSDRVTKQFYVGGCDR